MTDRIEPIRREDATAPIPPVVLPSRRERERRRDEQRRERRHEPQPAVTRDDDGAPHVDIRA
jgi:hypothetical protein